jgi:long-subunit fatty acid transport protein
MRLGHRADSPTTIPRGRALAIAAVVAALGTALGISPAHASPRTDPTSGRAVFTGAANVHPTSLRVNPAMIGVDAAVGVYVAYVAGTFMLEHEQIDRDDQAPDFSGPADLSEARTTLGAELSISWHPTERISVGVGVRAAPEETFSGSAGALSYHNMGGRQRDLSATVAGALRVSSIFYVGAALSLQQYRLNLRFARDTALFAPSGQPLDCGGAPCGLGNPQAAEVYDVDVEPSNIFSNQNLALTLGLVLKLGAATYVGLGYHTPPGFAVQTSLVGDVRVTRAPRDVAAGGEAVVSGEAAVDVSYPANVELGLRTLVARELLLVAGLRWEDTSRLSGYDVRPHGSRLTEAGIPEWIRKARGLTDSVAGWVGVEQLDQGESWRLGGRLGYELGSTSDARVSPSGNSTQSLTLDLGAQWRLQSAPWSLQASYGLAYFLPVSVEDSAFSSLNTVACVGSNYNYASRACAATRGGYGIESANGDYAKWQHAIRFGARYEF